MDAAQSVKELCVVVFVERVEVSADGTREEDGVLWDDGDAGAEVMETEGRDVEAVDKDAAGGRADELEECES